MAALTNQMMTKWSYNQQFKEPVCLDHRGGVVLYSPSKVYHTRVVYSNWTLMQDVELCCANYVQQFMSVYLICIIPLVDGH